MKTTTEKTNENIQRLKDLRKEIKGDLPAPKKPTYKIIIERDDYDPSED